MLGTGERARSNLFPQFWRKMKELDTNVRGNKCCKNICFSFLHLLHFIPPLPFGSFPNLSSWFFSPPPVLFLPEEQHYPLLSLCTVFYFFPFLHTAPLLAAFHTLCGSSACRRRAAAGLPSNVSASYHCSSTSAAPGEEGVAGEEIEEAGVGET